LRNTKFLFLAILAVLSLNSCDFFAQLTATEPSATISGGFPSDYAEFSVDANNPLFISLSSGGSDPITEYSWDTVNWTGVSGSANISLLSEFPAVGDSKTLRWRVTNIKGSITQTITLKRVAFPVGTDLTKAGDPIVPLGAHYTTLATTFRIWSPSHSNPKIFIGDPGSEIEHNLVRVPRLGIYTDLWEVTVDGVSEGTLYQFQVGGKMVRDPYGRMINNTNGKNVVINTQTITPTASDLNASRPALMAKEDAILYEAHIRDFTIHSNSGVSDSKRARYAGMWEGGLTLTGNVGVKTGVDHLVELGVTHLQILPFYDYHTKAYNWGYDPENFNIPEEQYSEWYDPIPYYDGTSSTASTPKDNSNTLEAYRGRIAEVKTMVNELNKRGIRVVMDVVFSHTFQTEMFSNITSGYFDGLNLSGVGNSIDGGNLMVRRFIRDSLDYWVSEYGIDGFRFDLMGIYYTDAVKDWADYLKEKYPQRNLLIYGEPWNGYASDPQESKKVRMGSMPVLATSGVGVFNPKFREQIKGDNDGSGKGYMFGDGSATVALAQDITRGLQGALTWPGNYKLPPVPLVDSWDTMFAYLPFQSINYIGAHDNYILWDKIKTSFPETSPFTQSKAILRFAHSLILTAQGIPFIHAGDEFLRTKQGNHNSYKSPDSINAIDWSQKDTEKATFQYIQNLITLRKTYPEFRMTSYDDVRTRFISNQLDSNWDSRGQVPWIETRLLDSQKNLKLILVYNPNSTNLNWSPFQSFSGTIEKIFDDTGLLATPAPTPNTGTTISPRAFVAFKVIP